MKKMILMAAVLAVVGCGEKKADGMAGDTAAMAPTMSDTGMAGMSQDSGMMADTTMARDSMMKK